ncbi:MAG: hypothetical protein ACRDE5_07055, partial [Ginsengibacter sp.]
GMIRQFEKLTGEERELLYKAPVLVSVLASCSFNEINEIKKADAIKLSHLKTFTANPVLIPYYTEVEKNFKGLFEAAIRQYFPFDVVQRIALKKEMSRINRVIEKLDEEYARALNKSLEKYTRHVKRASHTVFVDFIFPLPMPGLTE